MERVPEAQQSDSPVKRALRAIDDLQAKLAAMERKKSEPIAVIGMGCRFPGGADSPQKFWDLLKNGEDTIIGLPADRWNIDEYYDADPDAPGKMYIRHGGFLNAIDRFDAPFFGISPREATCMDPQHRLVLEVSWEALEYAGIGPGSLIGSHTGVFVGIGQNDYARMKLNGEDRARIDTYDGTGNLFCFAAGRVSYVLGLRGPNMAIDTACSSSLVAIHQACQSLRAGECDLALAGGVHLIISPEITIFLSRAHVLSAQGHCKTFDAAADGFVRGEGCGMIVLKRLSDALRDRDTILALIRGSAINHDGASSGLTVPNERAQEEVILQATQNANIEPNQVTYVEAHGTGTALGDPIEVNALSAALCKGRAFDQPLLIGSVKTNLGHLEAAAGIAGVIKILLSLQHKEIPPHLHFDTPNPHVDWQRIPIEVAVQGRTWPSVQGRRIAGVSSFGFSGTNAHIVLEEAPETTIGAPAQRALHILTLSAKSDAALRCLAESYAGHLSAHPEQEIADICFTANTGRSRFAKRLSVIAATRAELSERLAAYCEGRTCTGLYTQDHSQDTVEVVCGEQEFGSMSAPDSLAELAKQFITGPDITWHDYHRGDSYRKVALPTYPFQRLRHWVEGPDDTAAQRAAKALPPWGKRLHLPFARDVRFEHYLNPNAPAHLSDHRLLGTVVVSAASQVSMVLASATDAFGSDACQIRNMLFAQPLMLSAKGGKTVQVIYVPADEGMVDFKLVSAESGLEATDSSWATHASGTVDIAPKQQPIVSEPGFDPDHFRSRAKRTLAGDAFYTARHQSGYQFGPSFRWVQGIWQTDNETLCEMAPRLSHPDDARYTLHPGLLDSCFQMIDGCWADAPDSEHLFVPVKIGHIRIYKQPPTGGLWCLAQRDARNSADARIRAGGLRLMDEKGETLVTVDGFELGQAPRVLFLAQKPRQEAVYEVNWMPATLGNLALFETTGQSIKGIWLLFADRAGIATQLAQLLRACGDQVVLVDQASQYVVHAINQYGVNPQCPEDFGRLLQAIGTPLKGVVYLWGIDLGSTVDEEAILQAEITSAGLTATVRALVEWGNRGPLTLWFVTQGAQPVDQGPVAVLQAMVWGIGSVLDLEHPELGSRGIDLAPCRTETMLPLLLQELLHPDAENKIALRDGTRLVARLEQVTTIRKNDLHLDANASYLITGGFGGLGLEVARWLERKGARNLILCGRNGPNALAVETIGRIECSGCKVQAFTADVSKLEDVKRLMAGIEARMPPLRGIVHAAGIIDDALLIRQERDRFRKVMAPKVRGTWNLHGLTTGKPLDFFICFSSAAAIVGAGGQANYAAANAFMDALMHARRALGLHGLSINWGAWREVGMAAKMKEDVRDRVAAQGMGAISPETGLTILEELLQGDVTQACVMAVDWHRYMEHHYSQGPPLFYQAVGGKWATVSKPTDPLLGSPGWLSQTAADQRQARLFDYIRSQVAATLGMTTPEQLEPRQRLFDIGIDSLMAVELKNRLEAGLGLTLRSTLVFDYPTLNALITYLVEDALAPLFPQTSSQAKNELAPNDDGIGSLLSEIEGMPEQELRAMFSNGNKKRQGLFP